MMNSLAYLNESQEVAAAIVCTCFGGNTKCLVAFQFRNTDKNSNGQSEKNDGHYSAVGRTGES